MRRSGTGVRTGPPARDRARTAVRSRSRRRGPCGRSPCTPSGDPGRRNRHHRQRCRRRHSKPRWCRAFSGPYGCGVRPTRPVHRPQARRWQARHGCTRPRRSVASALDVDVGQRPKRENRACSWCSARSTSIAKACLARVRPCCVRATSWLRAARAPTRPPRRPGPAAVRMIGHVGDDSFGRFARQAMAQPASIAPRSPLRTRRPGVAVIGVDQERGEPDHGGERRQSRQRCRPGAGS